MKTKTSKAFLEKIQTLTFGFGHKSSSGKPPQIGDEITCPDCGATGTVVGEIILQPVNGRREMPRKEDESSSFAA